jgi:hypothetical protein
LTEEPREVGYFEAQWRKLKNPPPPVVRAVLANLAVALVLGIALLIYDLVVADAQMAPLIALYVVVVIAVGSVLTYLWVELPTGASGERRKSPWAGVLGLFAAIPIVYLVLVLLFQIVKPIIGG